jgi:hypothetical protein
MSTFGCYGFALFCSLFEVAGAGRVAPRKPTISRAEVQTVLPYNEADESWAGFILFPVVGGVMTRGLEPSM